MKNITICRFLFRFNCFSYWLYVEKWMIVCLHAEMSINLFGFSLFALALSLSLSFPASVSGGLCNAVRCDAMSMSQWEYEKVLIVLFHLIFFPHFFPVILFLVSKFLLFPMFCFGTNGNFIRRWQAPLPTNQLQRSHTHEARQNDWNGKWRCAMYRMCTMLMCECTMCIWVKRWEDFRL